MGWIIELIEIVEARLALVTQDCHIQKSQLHPLSVTNTMCPQLF